MTSKPASRNAREMTLAPRSCPSRPTLATTTRYARRTASDTRRVARRPAQSRPRTRTVTRTLPRAAWIGLAVVLLLVGGMGLVSWLCRKGTGDVNPGDKEAGPYNATVIAKQIAADGPLLLPDASPNRSLDVYLQHLGV